MNPTVKIFDYVEVLDCFVVNSTYESIARRLGLIEWSAVVWIGRFFAMDNDFGEHWFDNWALRDTLETKAAEQGVSYDDLLVLDPDRFKDGSGGPCHSLKIGLLSGGMFLFLCELVAKRFLWKRVISIAIVRTRLRTKSRTWKIG